MKAKDIIEKIEEQIIETKALESHYRAAAEKAHAAWNLDQASFCRDQANYQKQIRYILSKLIGKGGE